MLIGGVFISFPATFWADYYDLSQACRYCFGMAAGLCFMFLAVFIGRLALGFFYVS
jgi:hypothetical protein